MKTMWMRLVGGLATVAMLSAMISPGTARGDEDTVTHQPVVVVMDFSGSMNTADADAQGTTRLTAAKTAVTNLLGSTPEEARLGLVVFGTASDECTDIRTLNPVGPFDAAELSAQVNELNATGNTPIGPALLHAADELDGIEGPRSIVLVSDGEPNCEPPPACDVAQELADRGIDLTIHTVGFRISENRTAQQVLRCIADTTGGEYVDADSADELDDALQDQTLRALEGYVAEGEQVEGGLSAEAPTGLVAGQYVTRLVSGSGHPAERPGSREYDHVRWFSAPVHEGWLINVSATLIEGAVEERGGGSTWHLSIAAAAMQEDCALPEWSGQSINVGGLAPYPTATLRLGDEAATAACANDDGELVFGIYRTGNAWSDQELDVEFTLAYERVTDEVEEIADPVFDGEVQTTDPVPVTGGNGFNRAVDVSSGQTISDTIVPGERRYYAVPVEYGQSLQAQVVLTGNTQRADFLRLHVFNSLREQLWLEGSEHRGGGSDTFGGPAGSVHTDALMQGIAPQHRLAGGDLVGHGVPGVQYVVVSRRYHSGFDTELPYNLTLTAVGDAVEGGIDFVRTPEEYAAAFETADVPTAEPVGTPSSAPAGEPSEDVAAPDDDAEPAGDGSPVLAYALGGIGLVLLLSGATWLVIRRRSGV